jgi:hypothetical protein
MIMEGSNFLDNLKKAVDSGEFNSDAAKKILEVNRLADDKVKDLVRVDEETVTSKSVDKRLEEAGIKTVSKEEAIELNSQYEKKMLELEKKQLNDDRMLVLTDIENMVKLSVEDMMGFIKESEEFIQTKYGNDDPMFDELKTKINEIKTKYSSINN